MANCQGHKWFDNSFKNEQQVSVSVDLTATGDEVLPGEYLLFRFISKVLDTTQTDQTLYNGMGMDDLSITFHWESGTSTSTVFFLQASKYINFFQREHLEILISMDF